MKQKTKDILLLLIIVVIWGGGYAAVEYAYNFGWSPIGVLFFRSLFALITSIVAWLVLKSKFDKQSIILGLIAGIIYAVAYLLQLLGQSRSTVTNTGLLTSTTVLLVPLLSFLVYGNKINLKTIVCCVFAFIGAYILTIGGELSSFSVGDLLILISAIAFSIHIIFVEKRGKDLDVLQISIGSSISMSLIYAVLFLFNSKDAIGEPIGWLPVLYYGVLSGALCFILQQKVLKTTPAPIVSLVLTLEGVVATICGILLFQEELTLPLIIGGSIMILSAFISQLEFKERKK